MENFGFITIKTIIVRIIYVVLLLSTVKSTNNLKEYMVVLVLYTLLNNLLDVYKRQGSIFILFTTLVFIILDRFRRKINFKKFITIIFSIISIGMIGICIFFNKIIITLNNLPYNKFEFPTFFSYLVSNRAVSYTHLLIIRLQQKMVLLQKHMKLV